MADAVQFRDFSASDNLCQLISIKISIPREMKHAIPDEANEAAKNLYGRNQVRGWQKICQSGERPVRTGTFDFDASA
jgi:hypothetical protein